MLYSSPETGAGNQFIPGNRFKTIATNGTGVFTSNWQQPRVIFANRLMGTVQDPSGNDTYKLHTKYGRLPNPNYEDPLDYIPPLEDLEPGEVAAGASRLPSSYISDFVGPAGDSQSIFKFGSTNLIYRHRVIWRCIRTLQSLGCCRSDEISQCAC